MGRHRVERWHHSFCMVSRTARKILLLSSRRRSTRGRPYLDRQEYPLTRLCDDSLSLVNRIQLGRMMETWITTIQQIVAKVVLVYIPCHASIKLNERADKLAGRAEPFGELVKTHADVIRTIRNNAIANYAELPPSWSKQRLLDREIDWGEGSYCMLPGKQ